MMTAMHIVYAVIVAFTLFQWGFNRYVLGFQGLSTEFCKIRIEPAFNGLFQKKLKSYIYIMAVLFIQGAFTWFCASRLLSGLGIFGFESGFVLTLLTIFFIKDRLYYETALFFVTRWRLQ